MNDVTKRDSDNLQVEPITSPFDKIRRVRSDGSEYWSAREMMPQLGYSGWRNIEAAVTRAKLACENTGYVVANHFVGANKMVDIGSGVVREMDDVHMSRLGCYFVAINGDPRKPKVARAQHYFVVRTREAELSGLAQQVAPVQDQPAVADEDSGLTRQEILAEGRPAIASRLGVMARNHARLAAKFEAIPYALDLCEVVNDKVDASEQALADAVARITVLEQMVFALKQLIDVTAKPNTPAALTYVRNIPLATELPAPLKTRKKINRMIRGYARDNEVPYENVWNDCYVEFRDRYEFDARRRAKRAGVDPLDTIEGANLMEEFFKVVCWYVRNNGISK